MNALFAQVDEVALFIPIVAIVIGGLIALVTMLTNHQRKMAELLRKDVQQPTGLVDEIRALRGEMSELRDRVNQQTLMLERRTCAEQDVPRRIENQ
jgi:hypothetical protein